MESKVRALEESLSQIERWSKKDSDGTWLEDETVKVGSVIREWDFSSCVSWDSWKKSEHFHGYTSSQDIGIDAVGTRDSGRFVAIQCKSRKLNYDGTGRQITKSEIDSFASMTQSDIWEERWIVTNGDNPLAANAQQAVLTMPNPLKMVIIGRDVQQELYALKEALVQNETSTSKTEMQNEVVAQCVSRLREHVESNSGGCPRGEARGRLILPCGTGKTRISLRIIEELTESGGLSVVLCPSIALVAQIRREYLQFCEEKIDALAVCSDQSAGITKKDEGVLPENDPTRDTSFVSASEVKGRVTTEVEEIASFMSSKRAKSRVKIIFGTYQSARRIAEALERTRSTVDVLIADEAHRTAGIRRPNSKRSKERVGEFTLCHDRLAFPAKFRVYQTATPRVYSIERQRRAKDDWAVRTMDDESIFGVQLARRSYLDAVRNGWLCDYRIIAVGINDEAAFEQANKLASMARSDSVESLKTAHYLRGLSFALAMSGATLDESKGNVSIGSCIAFMNTIEKSKNMAKSLSQPEVHDFISKWFAKNEIEQSAAKYSLRHLDASANVTRRQHALQELSLSSTEEPFGILNVGIFGEGTDSPALNAVAFLEPRKSPIDVIQAVGRAMRTSPGKEVGYIICPVLIPPNVDPESWLSTSSMAEGWTELGEILLALRAHDGRIETDLEHLINFYLPADPKVTRNLVAVVNESNKIEYYEHEGASGDVYDLINKVATEETTPRQAGLVKLANRSRRNWQISEPGLMITGKLKDGSVEIREDAVQRTKAKDGARGAIDLKKCRERMAKMINDNFGRKHVKRKKKRKSKPETAGFRLLRLADATGNEKAIRLNLLKESGLRINRVDRDLNVLQASVNEAARHLETDNLEPILAQHFGYDRLKNDKSKKRANASTVASLILMNAAMMQQRIDQTGYIDTRRKLAEAQHHPDLVSFLRRCWNSILSHDYKTVFEPAVELLDTIEDESGRLAGLERALHHIAGEAERIAQTYADMGMDHAGPLFNRVMGDQDSDGAYFTRPLAAFLVVAQFEFRFL